MTAATHPESATVDLTERSKPPADDDYDDEAHAECDDGHDRRLYEDVAEVQRREEAVRRQRGQRAQDEQGEERHLCAQVQLGMVVMPAAIAWRGEPSRLPGDVDLALILALEAAEDGNACHFAGAVLVDQGMGFPTEDGKVLSRARVAPKPDDWP